MNKLVTARPPIEPRLPERRRRKKRKSGLALPALIAGAGQGAAHRFRDFFTVNIRNRNTRAAYARAAAVFLRWCEGQGITRLQNVKPVHVAAYIEQLSREMSPPSVKQHLACIRMLFDWPSGASPTNTKCTVGPFGRHSRMQCHRNGR
jgi:hypothetical protein